MSWLGGYKPKKVSESELREERRRKLESDRLERQQRRQETKQQLLAAKQAQLEADQAIQDLLDIDPTILDGDEVSVAESEIEYLLADDSTNPVNAMEDFETENGVDGEKVMDKLGSIKCEFTKDDIEFWFSELETQLEVIEVKSQWTKRIALQRFLPADIKQEVKSLLVIQKAQAGNDIYKRIKAELLDLFGAKPEDAKSKLKIES